MIPTSFGRILGRRAKARILYPFNREARRAYRQSLFEAIYLESGDPIQIRAGLAALWSWDVAFDENDPDLENRPLNRRLIELDLAGDPQAMSIRENLLHSIARQIVAHLGSQALKDGVRHFEIEEPRFGSCPITWVSENGRREAGCLPEGSLDSIIRELEFAATCRPGSYFASTDPASAIDSISVFRRVNGSVRVNLNVPCANESESA